ncbi:rod shape-determining protein MreB [Natranaerovirga hydrolytica]|uniref:Cell shape-determining protein MreB n=1 Tax=Natranaerovirga hydrolytica TaxID=680378 RepID=A0A4R1MY02_9FIRM|nr:rod shape-determining protein [Natranaerovirga hydrolytica]TCK98086.1 rod shape-determining protein MreB [Natranaerovirga hydrolytica]
MVLAKVIGIDLGTKSVKIYKKYKGVVLLENNIIAQQKRSKNIFAAGNKAYEMLERTPKDIFVSYPVRSGVIADFDNMVKLINWYLNKINCKKGLFSNNTAYISVPWDISEVEKRAIYDLINHSNASIKKIKIIDKPIAAALGADINVQSPEGNMIVDIGGDTTEISVVSLGGIVSSKLINIGGNHLDEAIINYTKKNKGILIGSRTAEVVKMNLSTAIETNIGSIKVFGRDLVTGLPKEFEINSLEVYYAIKEYLYSIIDTIKFILERTPPELSADIIEQGIYLTGGGALIEGLPELIYKETDLKVNCVEEPMNSVIRGIGKIVEKTNTYESLIVAPKAKKYKYS